MRKVALVCEVLCLQGCAIYKIVPAGNDAFYTAARLNPDHVTIDQPENDRLPEGFQCFEPLLSLLTAGIVPQHCVSVYTARIRANIGGSPILEHFRVSSLNGWVALLLAPLPSWKYGSVYPVKPKIENYVQLRSK